MRYRVEFSKQKEARFVSHLDTMKTVERAIRRGRIPIAFSEGFNPHPKMAFGSAVAVGVTSDQEFLDLELTAEWEPSLLQDTLNISLPSGYRVRHVVKVAPSTPALMSVLNCADYLTRAYLNKPLEAEEVNKLVSDFLASPEIKFEKNTKKGKREVDLRPGIYKLTGQVQDGVIILRMLLKSGSEGNVRPEDVLAAFAKFANLELDVTAAGIHRLALYIHQGDKLNSPMGLL
jgi:radical SAM-linked protein